MYDFLFYFFYKLLKKWGTVDPPDNAVTCVLFAILGHLLLLDAVVSYFFDFNIAQAAFGKGSSKYVALPFVIALMVFVYGTYKRRKEKVFEKYANSLEVNSANSFIVFCLVVVPYIVAIYLLK